MHQHHVAGCLFKINQNCYGPTTAVLLHTLTQWCLHVTLTNKALVSFISREEGLEITLSTARGLLQQQRGGKEAKENNSLYLLIFYSTPKSENVNEHLHSVLLLSQV